MENNIVLFLLLKKLKSILPKKDFRVIIENVFIYGKCSLCPVVTNLPKIVVHISSINLERVGFRFYPYIICHEKYDKKHLIRVCWDCEKWYQKYGKKKYDSVMMLIRERNFFLSEN